MSKILTLESSLKKCNLDISHNIPPHLLSEFLVIEDGITEEKLSNYFSSEVFLYEAKAAYEKIKWGAVADIRYVLLLSAAESNNLYLNAAEEFSYAATCKKMPQ